MGLSVTGINDINVLSRNRNMTFIITIKAIMTVREMPWLTCQNVKKRVVCITLYYAKIIHLTVAKKLDLGVNSYLQVIWRIMCIGW